MRGLTLWQPWATMIALLEKRLETRSWESSYRGPIAVHAAARWSREQVETCRSAPFLQLLTKHGRVRAGELEVPRGKFTLAAPAGIPFGAVVAIAELVDCMPGDRAVLQVERQEILAGEHELALGYFIPRLGDGRRFAWRLRAIQPLRTPVVCAGAQGLWAVPPDLEARIRAEVTP